MTAANLRGRAYFSKLLSRTGGSTLQPEREAQPEREVELIEPISRVEVVIEIDDAANVVVEPSKKSRKRDRSSRRSHSSPRRHRHVSRSSSQPLPETIFDTSTRFLEFVHTNIDGPSQHMFWATNLSSLTNSGLSLLNVLW